MIQLTNPDGNTHIRINGFFWRARPKEGDTNIQIWIEYSVGTNENNTFTPVYEGNISIPESDPNYNTLLTSNITANNVPFAQGFQAFVENFLVNNGYIQGSVV